ncbi:MAG: glycoside hydrolase family 2 TIM barrel-domain containing protein, partial [Candidatus Ornithomonoglobus sp.]
LPLTIWSMIYDSMMMAHNNDRTAAYCTDPVITIPAVELETLVYSDENTIELLPAMLPELEQGGALGGSEGMHTRNGGKVSALEWNETGVTAKISESEGTRLKLTKSYDTLTVNGADVTAELKRDSTGDSYYEIATNDEITVLYTYSDVQNGTYSIIKDGKKLAVQDIVNGSEVNTESAITDSRASLWNAEGVTSNGFKLINTYTGKALTYDGNKITQSNYTGADNQIWVISDNELTTLDGKTVAAAVSAEADTEVQTTIDTLSISADKTVVRNGGEISFSAATEPKKGINSGIDWVLENGTGSASIDKNGVLTATAKGTVSVYAKAKIGTAQSEKIEITINSGIEDYTKITDGYYTVFGRTEGQWEPANPPANAFDGKADTAYDGQGGGYCGVEFKEPQKITAFRYMPRAKQESRMPGTRFEVSNDGTNYTAVYTVRDTGSNGTYYPVFAEDLDEETSRLLAENKFKYFRFSSGSSGYANIAEIEVYTDELQGDPTPETTPEPPVEGEGKVIWADDIVSAGGAHQGTGGNTDKNDFGNFQNTDDKIKKFFPEAEDGKAIGSYTRLNAIDNWGNSAQWDGYVETTVTAPKAGNYRVYVLGNTNQSTRQLELTNTTNSKSQISGSGVQYSTANWLMMYEYIIELAEGENTLKLQAPAGSSAPNFIAMYVEGIGGAANPTPTPTAKPTEAPTPTAKPTEAPTPTAKPTEAPTPTAKPTEAPTPKPYEIKSYSSEVNSDGTAVLKTADVYVQNPEGVRLYSAVYDSAGVLAGVKLSDVTAAGESTIDINITAPSGGSAKIFLWRDMEPLTAVKTVSFAEEETMRISENFNREWSFAYGDMAGAETVDYDDSEWADVALPHSFSIPYDLNQGSFYVGCGWYRKEFEVSADWDDKFISLDFEGVFQVADIYVNGIHVPQSKVYGQEDRTDENEPTHEGGYSGFSVDITDYVTAGTENIVAVKVDNIWQPDLTPRGGDHQFSGGIYRDVTLTAVNKAHVDWYGTFVWTPALCNPAYQVSENRPDSQYKNDFERNGTGITNTLDDPKIEGEYVTEAEMLENIKNRTSDVEVQTEITNTNDKNISLYVKNIIKDADGNTVKEFNSDTIDFAPNEKKTVTARSEKIEGVKLWDFDNPNLYTAVTEIYTASGVKIDNYQTEFGFRSAQFKLDGFYINGVRTLLDGANVHQDHGGWADAVTNEGFMRDVKYVKAAGFNFIRGSHYPHDPSFAEACDKLGIGFWSEGGLWSIGGYNDNDTVDMKPSDWTRSAYPLNGTPEQLEHFEQSCYDIVGSMIRVNRNHPSVIVWSMGNEAFFSDDAVADKVKNLVSDLRDYAHSLDYTRKAGLGGTQRKDLNVLAVCDVAGGNGDGGTAQYTNFYLPHLVAEYGSDTNDRPGTAAFNYEQIEDAADITKYVLPSKTVTFADGTTAESSSAGLSIWCMYHHGSVAASVPGGTVYTEAEVVDSSGSIIGKGLL